ncbi:hypothetical protein ANN_04629 [Periplaneta americana]|uniref:Uncharacterized protein n=1 Tax=Periplaneta americana TaxID=6978 RepID=A0ABQ8TAH2_PERAM|nr:hypothetical protein ANN_04629 [Periplaneta americana]
MTDCLFWENRFYSTGQAPRENRGENTAIKLCENIVEFPVTTCPVAVWLLKRRIKTCGSVLNSPVLPEVNMVSKVKKNDVKKLMQYFEVTGEAKNLYTTVLADVSHQTFVIKL